MINFLRKVWYILGDSQRKLPVLIAVFFSTSILEALGIGLIGPFLAIASTPSQIQEIGLLARLFDGLNFSSERQFVALFGLFIVFLFLIKAIVYFAGKFYTFSFSFNQKKMLVSKLLETYLRVPYTFHLKKNTASIVKVTVLETNQFCNLCLLPALEILSNAVVVFSLLIVLAVTDSLLLSLILATLLPVIFFFIWLSKRFRQWGQDMSEAQQGMIRTLNHALGGLKETRVIGCESFFEAEMSQHSLRYAKSATLSSSLQMLPRTAIEAVLVIFLISLTSIALLTFEANFEQFIASLGVFAVAAMRLIPSISLLMQSFGLVRKSGYAVDMLFNDLKEIEKSEYQRDLSKRLNGFASKDSQKALPFKKEIQLKNITYTYPESQSPAIKNFSLTLKKGESIALIGKSGAGKTTVVDIILGLLKPQSGDITTDGLSIYKDLRAWQNIVGYIPQSIFLIDDTIERNIAFGVPDNLINQARLWQAIKTAQLEELITQLPQGVNTSVGERGVRLSGGQRQRIGIARALYHEREILVLDEATSALDNETEKLISESINRLSGDKTLIIIAHRLSTVEKCDQVYVMERGELSRSGTYSEVVSCL
ncbi:MAG: ABC transporter ATP-binding protein [Almyronema sp.]